MPLPWKVPTPRQLLGSLVAAAILLLPAATTVGQKIEFRPERRVCKTPFELALSSKSPGTILYTTDGSKPSRTTGKLYSQPITIAKTTVVRAAIVSTKGKSKRVYTHTFLFPEQVWKQPAEPQGVIRSAISVRHGPDKPQEFDWAMDPDLLKTDIDRAALLNGLNDLPSLAVSLKLADFNFLYENHRKRGVTFERPASIELIYPKDERFEKFKGFQIDCGMRMHGGLAVDQARKKSFRVLFKKKYGSGKLSYPIFESAAHHATTEAAHYDTLILRSGGNGNWSKDIAWKHEPGMYLRDTLVRDSQIAMSDFGARSTFAHLYLNGLYYGLFNIAERPEAKFMSSYWGGDEKEFYAINHHGTVNGDPQPWNRAVQTANIKQRIDIDAFCDYIILNWAVGMGDWPWNNFYAGMRTKPLGKIRFFAWDAEHAFWTNSGYLGSNPGGWANPLFLSKRATNYRYSSPILDIWGALFQDPDFKQAFADRVFVHCFHDGALTDRQLSARFQSLVKQLDKAIVAESCKWGDSAWGREDQPHTREADFVVNCNKVAKLIEGNQKRFISALRRRRIYPLTDAPEIVLPAGGKRTSGEVLVPSGTPIIWKPTPAKTTIYFTTDGKDPRLTGGRVNPKAKQARSGEPISITSPQTIQARALSGKEWSPLMRHTFLPIGQASPVRISELMYQPQANPHGEALEFIEITNTNNVPISLSGCRLQGVRYGFPPNFRIAPKQVLVLIPNEDPKAFTQRFPSTNIFGVYRKQLSNDGEHVAIVDKNNRVIDEVTYRTSGEWPREAAGGGASLNRRDLMSKQSGPTGWQAKEPSPGVISLAP